MRGLICVFYPTLRYVQAVASGLVCFDALFTVLKEESFWSCPGYAWSMTVEQLR